MLTQTPVFQHLGRQTQVKGEACLRNSVPTPCRPLPGAPRSPALEQHAAPGASVPPLGGGAPLPVKSNPLPAINADARPVLQLHQTLAVRFWIHRGPKQPVVKSLIML